MKKSSLMLIFRYNNHYLTSMNGMNNDQYLKNQNKASREYIQKIKKLLESKQDSNLLLAFQLIENGGVPANLLTHLYAISICHDNFEITDQANTLFTQNAPQPLLTYTQRLWAQKDLFSLSEPEISDFLTNTQAIQELDTPLLANLLLKLGGAGGAFCLKNNTAPKEEVLQEIYNTEWMSLASFELTELPPEIGLFTDTRHLVISHNHCTDIPDELQTLVKLERIYFDNTPLSDDAFQKMDRFFPKAMGNYYSDLGREAFRDKHYQEAAHYMKKAITLDATKADYWNTQGVILGRLKKRKEAIHCFNEAIAINPKDTLAYSNQAHIYHLMGKEQLSLTAANTGLTLYQQHPQLSRSWESTLYFRKGQALFHLRYYQESNEAYDASLNIDPLFGGAWFNKACTYACLNDKSAMLRHLKEAIRCDAKFKRDAPEDTDFEEYWHDEDFLALIRT